MMDNYYTYEKLEQFKQAELEKKIRRGAFIHYDENDCDCPHCSASGGRSTLRSSGFLAGARRMFRKLGTGISKLL